MTYAKIEHGVCVNIIVCDAEFAKTHGFIECPDGYGIDDFYEDGEWTKAPQPEPEPEPEPEPTPDVWDELDAAYQEGVDSV